MSLRRIPGARPVPAGRAVRAALSTTPQAGPAAPASAPPAASPGVGQRVRPDIRRLPPWAPSAVRDLPLLPVLALSAVMNTDRLSQNGFANVFYSAGVKSMLLSLHNFVFVSSDPGGLITIDKPPLGLWLQAASAKIFGFSPASLLLPEAIVGVLSVAALYWVMVRPFGRVAALGGALVLAIFPSFVAVSRDNTLDALLVILLILACGLALRACESGRLGTLLGSAVMVGLAFNTKTLAGLVVVPGIALAYLLCAPGRLSRRIIHLLAAALLIVLLGGAWIAFVELTPASERPYVGGSTNNTEINLTFGYNGFGRVEGQKGGPGQITLTNLPRELLHRRELEALPAEEARNAELLGVAHRAAPPSRSATRPAGLAAGRSSCGRAPARRPRPGATAFRHHARPPPQTAVSPARSPSAPPSGRCGCSRSAWTPREAGSCPSPSAGSSPWPCWWP